MTVITWQKAGSGNNLSKKFNFEILDDMLAVLRNLVVKQQHEESSGHVT